ncbi:MAG: choice-of-anchor Q domain-containing protein [Candidatus Electrothrix aestuarii]|uniref:Choice-of-anchor Q domain-containing protein n=1 Tax=Candidatus Electrothrix aestuarii TaxID=3062594 RepID=A0AAU8LYX3_9BACT
MLHRAHHPRSCPCSICCYWAEIINREDPESSAINAGTGTGAPATDQRGFSRDAQIDIGAYEYLAESKKSPYIVMILKMLLL